MTRPFDKHLDSDELDGLVSSHAAGVTDSGSLSEQALKETQRHVESCQDCSRKVQMHRSVQSEIASMGVPGNVPPGPNCVTDTEWLEVAAGLLPEIKTRELMKHAAQCGNCGPLLKSAAETLADEVSPDEEMVLASLSSAHPEWQQNMAAILRDGVQEQQQKITWWRGMFTWPNPAYGFAGIAVVVLVAWIALRTLGPSSANQLLAQAYSEHRTLEVRIPGAQYAPLQTERGTRRSDFDKSQSLLKAKALIGEHLTKDPNDAAWLQAGARSDLLDGNYEPAIKSLKRALGTQPDSASLLIDLGSAYFLRAESADRPIDYGNAIESFGKALAKSPDDPVALFNRAIASERMFLYTQAVDDWEHYLRVDPQGEWSDDARRRLTTLKEKLQQREKGQSEHLLSPKEIAKADSEDTDVPEKIDARAEDYLDEAIQRWLPAAFPEEGAHSSAELRTQNRAALIMLAGLLAARHQDTWLTDLLRTTPSASLSLGFRSLSRAAAANIAGDPDSAFGLASQAEMFFQTADSRAGQTRAATEEIYALHRQYHLQACLARIEQVEPTLRNGRYSWIRTQTDLEHYACATDPGGQLLVAARKGAQEANYKTLYLRALGFSASNETSSGSPDRAWVWDRSGLEKYWAGHYPPLRAQHFYDDLSISAQDSAKWRLAVALGREAVSAIASSPNRTGEGLARIRLARSAGHAHLWQEAAQQYSQALDAFSSIPQDSSTRALRASAEVGLADVALSQGHFRDAEPHLHYARENLPSDFEEDETWLAFYRELAELRKEAGDATQAQRACEAAVLVGEMGLAEVHNELERLRWKQNSSECYKRLVESKLSEHDEISALELWEWYQSAGTRLPQTVPRQPARFADLDRSPVLPDLHAVATELPALDRETVIVYAELSDQVSAWVYDNRGIYWQRLEGSPAALKYASEAFAARCADRESDLTLLRASGRNLYDLLVAPLVARLDPNRTLVIEADEGVAAIPFAALIKPNGDYLVERFSFVYLPSIGHRALLRASSPITRQDKALIVASPALSAKDQAVYTPLPDANTEAENVAAEFEQSELLHGKQATAARLSEVLPGAAIFHFAGHTRSQPGHSGLLLAPESGEVDAESTMLSADNISPQALSHLRLAVLSACSTGLDVSDEAEDVDSLARVFLRGGVPEVVATRWQVDSASTGALMRLFYQEVFSSESIPNALAHSMNRVRGLPGYSHPYYWAAFDAEGRL